MDFTENIIDTRDLQDRIDELNDDIDTLDNEISELSEEIDDLDENDPDDKNEIDLKLDDIEDKREQIEELQEELSMLLDVESEVPEFRHGETLIHENYWVEYVQDLCEDCGYISRDFPHWIAIDWDATADNVAADYSTIELDGNTYYFRNC